MKKALIVIDFQKDFVDGSLGFEGAKAIEPVIAQKVKKAIAEDSFIFFTLDTHTSDYLHTDEGRKLPIEHCIKGTEGWHLYGEVRKLAESIKDKATFIEKDQFGSLILANLLKVLSPDEVEVCGLVSNICVVVNCSVVKVAVPHAKMIVDSKATACVDPKLQQAAIDILKSIQVDVI